MAPPSRQSSLTSRRPSPSSDTPQKRRKKQVSSSDFDEALFSQISKLASERDEAGSFGEHVGARLRSFTPRQRALACLEIDKVLFNVEFPINAPVPPTHTPYITAIPHHSLQNQSCETPNTHSHAQFSTDEYQY